LNKNQLKTIENNTFVNLKALRELHFYENSIESIEVNSFDGPVSQRLHLFSNKLTRIENGTFSHMKKIKTASYSFKSNRNCRETCFPWS
jgi:hypothetical protein